MTDVESKKVVEACAMLQVCCFDRTTGQLRLGPKVAGDHLTELERRAVEKALEGYGASGWRQPVGQ